MRTGEDGEVLTGFHHNLFVGIVGNLVVVDDALQCLLGLEVVAATVEDVGPKDE